MNSIGFFPYGAIDHKAAQAYLDRRAAAGWVLCRVRLRCLAQFERSEGRSHFVDLNVSGGIWGSPDPDYLQLCADAGWEEVQRLRDMILFRSAPGARPAPIQSDDAMEQERFWRGYVRRQLLSGAVAVAAVVFSWLSALRNQDLAALVASNGALLFLLFLVLFLGNILWTCTATAAYYLRCRKAGRVVVPGGSLGRGALSILCSTLLTLSCVLVFTDAYGPGKTVDLAWNPNEHTATLELCGAYPVVTGGDLGLDPADSFSRYLDEHRSVLASYLSYSEVVSGGEASSHILTTERYDCAGAWLARWVLARRRAETAHGHFLWGELPWAPAPELGFDEGYTALDGAYVLLRQGDVVALVGCTELDLTAPEHLDALRVRLGLEG